MIFSSKAEYGVRLMVELGRQSPEQPTSLKAIADAEGLPLAYLEQVVARLRKAGLVMSARGAHGGYWLARGRPRRSRWTRSSQALEGSIAPMECFVHDHTERVAVLARARRRPRLRDQAAVDARAGRHHPLAADDDAGRAGRVLTPQRARSRRRAARRSASTARAAEPAA